MDVNRQISIMREQSKKRKRLLAQMFQMKSIKEFRESLGTDFYNNVFHWGDQEKCLNVRKKSRKSSRIAYDDASDDFLNKELPYKGTTAFLKGTRSCNPHNDYSQHFVDTGQRPQNFIRDVSIDARFGEYPKLRELIRLKDELITTTASPPMYLKCDMHSFELKELKSLFDVILIEPPLEEYQRTMGATNVDFWSWQQVMQLDIEAIASQRSFVFLWCGSSEGLDMGRACLRKWGFRRCEDICWIRTNLKNPGHSKNLDPNAIFQRTKEHCLMGIKGTVRRSVDGDFIHANVDIDLIISEENECGSFEKPTEIFCIIEHFCLGRRRLHVFGRDSTIRPGWLTVGPAITSTNFSPEKYGKLFSENNQTTGCTERIETLRPKSPPLKGKALALRSKTFNRGRR